jgi:GxxExxY protein
LKEASEELISTVLNSAFVVHTELGCGLLESVYQKALAIELEDKGFLVEAEKPVPLTYRGRDLGVAFRADIVVDDSLLLELKSVDRLNDTHLAQVLTYLRLMDLKRGLLLNFGERRLKDGIERISI